MPRTTQPIRVLTLNVRTARADPISLPDQTWHARLPRIVALIEEQAPDLLATQELRGDQRAELQAALPHYQSFGRGRRADGRGEEVALFLRSGRVRQVSGGTFWLSEEPDEPGSVGWDARFPRICTWAQVEVDAARRAVVLNVHLDHEGSVARAQGVALVMAKIRALAPDSPLVLTGDFNAGPGSQPVELARAQLVDTLLEANPEDAATGTFHDYGPGVGPRIDFIFASKHFDVLGADIVRTGPDAAGRYASDHHGVCATLAWEEGLAEGA